MHNPAQAIIDLFDEWKERGSPASGQVNVMQPDGWSEYRYAVRLLDEIELGLQMLDLKGFPVESFREQLPHWRASVTHFDRNWPSHSFALAQRDNLRHLVPLLHMVSAPGASETMPPNLLRKVDDVVALIRDDTDLDPALRAYVFKLADQIRHLLEEDRLGAGVDLQAAVHQMKIYMDAAAEQSSGDPEKQEKFRARAKDFVWNVSEMVTGGVLSGISLFQLTQ